MIQQNKKILLSFDVEEFDLPLEYKQSISIRDQLAISYNGLMQIREILDLPYIQATLFTTAFFAPHYPSEIASLSYRHEIASHTFYHSSFRNTDLKSSKDKLESITGTQVHGLRMPRMKKVDNNLIASAGYQYSSSINPTWIPGKYNHLMMSRTITKNNKLIQLPVSVTPCLRIPLFWLSFKNMPYTFFLKLVIQTLRHDGYICLYFHPWEFVDLVHYTLPFYIKRVNGKKLFLRLYQLIKDLSREGEFISMYEFIKNDL